MKSKYFTLLFISSWFLEGNLSHGIDSQESCKRFLLQLTGGTPVLINGKKVIIKDRSLFDPDQPNQHDLAYEFIKLEAERRGLNVFLQKRMAQGQSYSVQGRIFGQRTVQPKPRELTNVIVSHADSPDEVFQEDTILIGAHYDVINSTSGEWKTSFMDPTPLPYRFSPGADNNGSGVTGVFELMDRLIGHPIRSKVLYVFFDGGEPGIYGTSLGSFIFVESLPREALDKIKQVVILDMIGKSSRKNGNAYNLSIGNFARREFQKITALFPTQATATLPSRPQIHTPYDEFFIGTYSDSCHFLTAGIPAVLVSDVGNTQNTPPHNHAEYDTYKGMEWDFFGSVVNQVEQMIRIVFDSANDVFH